MKKIILVLVVLLMQFTMYAQGDKPTIQKLNYLVGIKTKADFKKAPYVQWYTTNYEEYQLDAAVVENIKKHIKGITIKAFMGTWCGDSKRETPHFYKILEAADFDEKNLEMIAVNRGKKTPDNLQEGLNILYVPTFIFYKDGKEIGRFVEYPQETLEKDILKIVSGQYYKHSYDID